MTDALTFFGLEHVAGAAPRWRMPVVRTLISGTGALFGGAGLGAAIEVAELETGRPVAWATAQYLAYAPEGEELTLDVHEVVRGKQVSQVRVIARTGEREILTVIGAFGRRTSELVGQWSVRPDVAPPDDCPPRPLMDRHVGTISSRMEMKLARGRAFWDLDGTAGDGNSALWVRFPGLSELKGSGLAIVGDYVPFGIGQAVGVRAGGNSLDNTLRVARLVDTEWILADVRVHAVHDGFGHGLVHLWADDGTLLGTASQSTMVRAWRDEAPPPTEEVK
jgi:acyl-CoA thioesterase II